MDTSTFPNQTLAGSSMQQLALDNTNARVALEKALHAIIQAAPHPRDYINNAELFSRANMEHLERCRQIEALIDHYMAVEIHCADQIKY